MSCSWGVCLSAFADWPLADLAACRPNPLYKAPNAQQYLLQQRQMHTSLAAGEVTVTSEYLPSHPALAPDLSKCAVGLAQPMRLALLELPGQHELGSSPLPELTVSPSGWPWDASGCYLAAPWGRAWDVEYMIGQPRTGLLDEGPCGIFLVDTSSWSTAEVAVGFQEIRAPALCSWSPCGLALVRHLRDSLLVWTLYSPSGSAVHSVTWSQLLQLEPGLGPQNVFQDPDASMTGGQKIVFAPAGSHLLLGLDPADRPGHLFLWAWQTSRLAQLACPPYAVQHAWSPDGTLLLQCCRGNAVLYGCCSGEQLSSQQLPGLVWSIAWAVSGTVAFHNQPAGWDVVISLSRWQHVYICTSCTWARLDQSLC